MFETHNSWAYHKQPDDFEHKVLRFQLETEYSCEKNLSLECTKKKFDSGVTTSQIREIAGCFNNSSSPLTSLSKTGFVNPAPLFTLEDEDGLIDLIVRPDIYARQPQLWHTTPLLLVSGTVQRAGAVVSVLVGAGSNSAGNL